MNEIKNKNEEKLIEDIENIKLELQKSINNMELIKDSYDKEQQNNFKDKFYEDSNPKFNIILKNDKFNFHITLFIPILQFLDIKSFMEFSKVNHLFYSFCFSFYFYRSINQILNHTKKLGKKINNIKIKKEKNSSMNDNINNREQEEENIIIGQTKKIYSSFMSAITGAFNYINPTTEITQKAKGIKDELKEIEEKIELHEYLIDEKIKQVKLSKEINNITKEIEKYINKVNRIKNKKENKSDNYSIKKKEKEKYEKEYNTLIKEINEIENENNKIKVNNDNQSKIGKQLDNIIDKFKYYENNQNNFV